MFLVVDGQAPRPGMTGGNDLKQDENYRIIAMSGGTYSEKALREWVNNTWGTPLDAPLPQVVKACNKGGWRVLQLLEV